MEKQYEYQLVILHPLREAVLVEIVASRWMLPIFTVPSNGSIVWAAHWLARRIGVTGIATRIMPRELIVSDGPAAVLFHTLRECPERSAKFKWLDRDQYSTMPALFPIQPFMLDSLQLPLAYREDRQYFERLRCQIRDLLTHTGRGPLGNFDQLRAGRSRGLLRFQTGTPLPVYCLYGDGLHREATLTMGLERISPKSFPRTLLHDPSGVWVLDGCESAPDDGQLDFSKVRRSVAAFTQLQQYLASSEFIEQRDFERWTPGQLLNCIDLIADLISETLEDGRVVDGIRSRRQTLRALIQELSDLDLPNSLTGTDFTPYNVVGSSDNPVFIDHEESGLGVPLFSLVSIMEWARLKGEPALANSFAETFWEIWPITPRQSTFTRALDLSRVLRPLAKLTVLADHPYAKEPERYGHHPIYVEHVRGWAGRLLRLLGASTAPEDRSLRI